MCTSGTSMMGLLVSSCSRRVSRADLSRLPLTATLTFLLIANDAKGASASWDSGACSFLW